MQTNNKKTNNKYSVLIKSIIFAMKNIELLVKMSTSTLQIRIDDNLKEQAIALFERLGLDLPTAVRIFLKKAVSENGVPFDLKDTPRISTMGLEALIELNNNAVANGTAGMTEEEIEKEIATAHAER